MKLWIVRTPTGDRPYVSINKPQSYIDHLDASGDKAEVFTIDVDDVMLKYLARDEPEFGWSHELQENIVTVRRER